MRKHFFIMPATKKKKEIWMTAAEIPQNSLFMMSEVSRFFIREWHRRGLGGHETKYFSYFKKDFTTMHYVRSEFDAQAEFLATKMMKNPKWALGLIDKVEQWSKEFMKRSAILRTATHHKLSSNKLVALYRACMKYQRLSHGIGASVSWHADTDEERVTKAIWKALSEHMSDIGSKRSLAGIFSVLTTPRQESFVSMEERDFLKIAIEFYKRPGVRRLFRTARSYSQLVDKLKQFHPDLYVRMNRHHAKYCWLAYQYKGPATSKEEYLGRWKELLKGNDNPRIMLETLIKERKDIIVQQRRLIQELRITPYLKQLIRLGQRMVFIKDFRKDALYHGMYCYEPLFKEIGRRLGLTLEQIWAMNSWEIPEVLKKGTFDSDELNARLKLAVAYVDRKKYVIYTGERAKAFLKKITFEKVVHENTDELSGTPACPGVVTGTVRIINIPQQIKKMNKGDVMVAHNTNPNLIPAMKKAAALVSESGGLTCHTAIVARELRTPCVVGVKGADKILKDGDRVEVDATKGIIKKL